MSEHPSPAVTGAAGASTRKGADPRAELIDLLRERSLRTGEFVLASGQRSDYYIDARVTTMSGRGQALIGPTALRMLDASNLTPGLVGGLTMGADPVAYSIAHAAALQDRSIDAFSVRKKPKDHGTSRRIEGAFDTSREILVVEDVITSGGSALEAVQAIREGGGTVIGVFAIVDRQQGGRERIEAEGLPVIAVCTAAELLGRADNDARAR
jgi:orotate phosphoribosyltransferase